MALPETFELTGGDGRNLRYCLYGPADGLPVISHIGSPSTRWKRPGTMEQQSGLRFLVYDRPGYGGSTRRPGRTVADAVDDVRTLADAHGWERFAIEGGSGGGPHALACAALLGERVTRCAVVSGIRPAEPGTRPREESELRTLLPGIAAGILGKIDAGGPEFPDEPGPPARENPDAMARIRATFVDSMDGWVDDCIAFASPWGFDPATITVPVGIWHGTADPDVPSGHSDWLLAHIPTAEGHAYTGGHRPGPDVAGRIHAWLRG